MRKILKPCGLHCIKVKHLGVSLGQQIILEDINLHIHCGSLNAVIGRNGAGKSTLIRAILGETAHTGTIEFKDRENGKIQKMKIGYVPQTLNIEKQTPVSVYDMIASYHSNVPVFLKKSRKMTEKILECLKLFEAEELLEKQVCNLSGGELQRVLLSMAVMDSPNLLLLDEPFSALDYQTRLEVCDDISSIIRTQKKTAILITHDLSEAISVADRILVLSSRPGRVKNVIPVPFSDQCIRPLQRRNAPEFTMYFNQIWKELRDHD